MEVIELAPSNKVTVPFGVQEYCGATVTGNVMTCPYTAGVAFEVTLVVVFALFINKVRSCVPEFDLESVTVTVNPKLPAVHDVPVSMPAELPTMPGGRREAGKLHVIGGVPPS